MRSWRHISRIALVTCPLAFAATVAFAAPGSIGKIVGFEASAKVSRMRDARPTPLDPKGAVGDDIFAGDRFKVDKGTLVVFVHGARQRIGESQGRWVTPATKPLAAPSGEIETLKSVARPAGRGKHLHGVVLHGSAGGFRAVPSVPGERAESRALRKPHAGENASGKGVRRGAQQGQRKQQVRRPAKPKAVRGGKSAS